MIKAILEKYDWKCYNREGMRKRKGNREKEERERMKGEKEEKKEMLIEKKRRESSIGKEIE